MVFPVLSDQVVMITGASSEIGVAIALIKALDWPEISTTLWGCHRR